MEHEEMLDANVGETVVARVHVGKGEMCTDVESVCGDLQKFDGKDGPRYLVKDGGRWVMFPLSSVTWVSPTAYFIHVDKPYQCLL